MLPFEAVVVPNLISEYFIYHMCKNIRLFACAITESRFSILIQAIMLLLCR